MLSHCTITPVRNLDSEYVEIGISRTLARGLKALEGKFLKHRDIRKSTHSKI
jgi:hypothetical protein